MSEKNKKKTKNYAGDYIGNYISKNSQEATNEMILGMDAFRRAANSTKNVAFDQSKGNLFEYIEAAKFNKNAAKAGINTRARVTAADGRPHDPADIELVNGRRVVKRVQAKFVDKSQKSGAKAITAEQAEAKTVAETVYKQAGSGQYGKYKNMQRLVRKDKSIDPEYDSLKDRMVSLAKKRAGMNGMNAEAYDDVAKNLTDELTDTTTGVKSGGTGLEEVKKAYKNPEKYAATMEMKQLGSEVLTTSANMAVSNAVVTGVVCSVQNMFEVLNDGKELKQALKDIGKQVGKSSAMGGATGGLSSVLRFVGKKAKIPVITDSDASVVIAGGIIDGGVAIYEYAHGEIDAEQLQQELTNTVVKATATIYFTKAIKLTLGAGNPFLTMAIYSVANYVVTSTREIINNCNLNAQQYRAMAQIIEESTKAIRNYKAQLIGQMEKYEQTQKIAMLELINNFEYNMRTGENYDNALSSLLMFADKTGMQLQHADFNDFAEGMMSNENFVLK